jgi:hypothetical protein
MTRSLLKRAAVVAGTVGALTLALAAPAAAHVTVNPKTATQGGYSDGNVVRWIEEPTTDSTEPEHPAPVLTLTPSAAEGAAAATAGPSVAAADTKGDGNGTPYGIAGIVLGLAGVVLGVLAYRRSSRSAPAAAAATAAEPDSVSAGTAG